MEASPVDNGRGKLARRPTHQPAAGPRTLTHMQISADTLQSQTLFHYRMEVFDADDHQVCWNRDDFTLSGTQGTDGNLILCIGTFKALHRSLAWLFSILLSPTHTNTHTHACECELTRLHTPVEYSQMDYYQSFELRNKGLLQATNLMLELIKKKKQRERFWLRSRRASLWYCTCPTNAAITLG